MKIHLIEDDPILARGLQINLELDSHQVHISSNLKNAVANQKSFEAEFVILDLGLPDGSGFDFLEILRKDNENIPVIILSAQSDEDSIIKGLQQGANDFVKKPYSYRELQARMMAALRKLGGRIESASTKNYEFAGLVVNQEERIVKYKDAALDFNRREFDIFLYMIQRPDRIVTRENLISVINNEGEIFDRTIDSHISHIRKVLKQSDVQTIKISSVYGLGYRLERA